MLYRRFYVFLSRARSQPQFRGWVKENVLWGERAAAYVIMHIVKMVFVRCLRGGGKALILGELPSGPS